MNLFAIDRSTDVQSAAFVPEGGGKIAARVFAGTDSRSGDWPLKTRDFLAENGCAMAAVDRFVVGLGPGSFAGVRAALAFAQGAALPGGKDVFGLPSTLALTREAGRLAVVGDARRDRYWIVLYDGVRTVRDFFLVEKERLGASVPEDYDVTTPDGARIDALLAAVFGARYRGAATPLAARLAEVALAHPDLLQRDSKPIYLQPPVRQNP